MGSGGQRKPSGTEVQTRYLLWLGVKPERPEAAGARGLTERYTHCRFNRLTACQSRLLLPSALPLRSDLRRAPLPPAFPPLCTPQPERSALLRIKAATSALSPRSAP